MWITNGGDADTMSVYAETDINAGANGITAFIIEKGSGHSQQARNAQGRMLGRGRR
jgi:alkylation response protein AidB-like acyl-CoA dehydrogenase